MADSKLDRMGDFPFTRLAALLQGVEPPAGRTPILMQIGEPQAAVPHSVLEDVAAHADLFGRYPPPPGSEAYRQAAAAWAERRYGLAPGAIDPARRILATSGSREALFQAALTAAALKEPQLPDGVRPAILTPNPHYHVYLGAGVMAGCDLIPVPATSDDNFTPDYSALPQEVLDRTALCFLCTPGNPTGAVTTAEDLSDMLALARRHGFVLAVDECYSEIWFDRPPTGGLQAAVALDGPDSDFRGLLIFNSLSKRSGAPGLRGGIVAGDADLIGALARVRSYGGATLPGPLMAAGARLWGEESHVEANRAHYRRLVELADDMLGDLPGYRRPEAAFFLWLDVRETAGDGERAAERLWAEEGVKVLPGRYMAQPDAAGADATPGDGYIRIALVHDEAVTADACRRIRACLMRAAAERAA